jgi:hypothetical protein
VEIKKLLQKDAMELLLGKLHYAGASFCTTEHFGSSH